MCNLYRMTQSRSEVAKLFDAGYDGGLGNAPPLVYPGCPGVVIEGGRLRQMNWGFPLSLKGAKGQKLKPRPVNNTRSDHLSSPFWHGSFLHHRCLIPLDAYAEAQGPKGGKTRTWIGWPQGELFACAGLWRESAEWGACYSLMITDPCIAVADIHHRMPVILAREDHEKWLHGSPEEAAACCKPWAGLLRIEHTTEPWSGVAA